MIRLKTSVERKLDMAQMTKFVLVRLEKIMKKGLAFSPVLTMFLRFNLDKNHHLRYM